MHAQEPARCVHQDVLALGCGMHPYQEARRWTHMDTCLGARTYSCEGTNLRVPSDGLEGERSASISIKKANLEIV